MMTDPYDTSLVPEPLKESLEAYQTQGRPTGDFLRAVLENDLFQAVHRADPHNLRILPAIAAHVHETLPTDCYGTKDKVADWLEGARLKAAPVIVGLPVIEGEVIDCEIVEEEFPEVEGTITFDSQGPKVGEIHKRPSLTVIDEAGGDLDWDKIDDILQDPRRQGARDGEE